MDAKSEEEFEDERTEEEIKAQAEKDKKLLIETEKYLKNGVHIGTKFKSGDMRRYILKKRKDGLMVFDIETIDKRIRLAAKTIAKLKGEEVAIVSRKLYGNKAVKKFAEMTGAIAFTGRFVPGTFTNPSSRTFTEPKLVIVSDPLSDSQAVKEAASIKVPVIAIAGSESPLRNIDLVIPANNKGRKALALIFYLLTREVLIARGDITKEGFKAEISDFEQEIEEKKPEKSRRGFQVRRFKRRY